MGATLSMKNLFGIMPGIYYGWPKNVLHHCGIRNSIVDINATRAPDLAIEVLSPSEAYALVATVSDEPNPRHVTFDDFCDVMNSPFNSVFDLSKSQRVYQDMRHPLSHYWMSSSHNTYLGGDQPSATVS